MLFTRHDDLTFIQTPGANASAAVATPSRGAADVSVVRQRQAPGGFNPPHTHDREEVIVLLAGSARMTLADATTTLQAGDSVIIPAGTPHQIANDGAIDAEWLLIAPAGIRFFHQSGEAATPPWSL